MRKTLSKYLISILSCLMLVFVGVGCNDKTSEEPPVISISNEYIAIDIFEEYDLDVLNAGNNVTWTSENEAVAIVDEDGVVMGVGEGTTNVVATIGETKLKCEVTVFASEQIPTIVTNAELVELLKDDVFTLNYYVSYDGQKYTNGKFTFESYDEDVATVSADGKITAKGLGETQVLVSADWEIFQESIYLTKLITVSVKEDVTLKIEEQTVTLGSFEISGYGKTYTNAYQLNYTIKYNGADVTENVVWNSTNKDVATVDAQGRITSHSIGDTEITVSYVTDETSYTSRPVKITVEKPFFDLTYKKAVLLDYSQESVTATAFKKAFDFNKQKDGGRNIEQIIDLRTGVDLLSDKTTLALDKLKFEPGEHTYRICNPDYEVYVNVFVATKVLTTAEDIVKLQEYGNIYAVDSNGAVTTENIDDALNGKYIYSGYFALGNDITFTSTDYADGLSYVAAKSVHMGSKQPTDAGFYGVFDGMGYTISGINVGGGSIFGDISSEGTVRNLSLKNVTCQKSINEGHYASALARNICGTIENVNIQIDLCDVRVSSALCYLFNGGTLRNVTVNVSNPRVDGVGALLIYWASGKCEIKNVFVNLIGDYPIVKACGIDLTLINKAEKNENTDDGNWTPFV